jgi:hypothetical protein
MRKIIGLKPLDNFVLEVTFENDYLKLFDFKNYLNLPVFAVLNNNEIFKTVKNKLYFIEWENYEIDLSADTLWHEGKDVTIENKLVT